MKAKKIISTAAIAAICAFALSAIGQSSPSPAATQAWVANFSKTNAAPSVAVSNAAVRVSADAARGMSAVMEILRTDTSTNAVQRAAAAMADSIAPAIASMMDTAVNL